ncbi:MAG: hypothetical protein OXR66_02490 [Candidatus Woesearchaeota archaeon]|nr:hypothetical protein [Candidatus Woesearchaeota archaeon]
MTTTQQTQEYIREHPDVKRCLKKGLINYSALSRHIAAELGIEKQTSMEAILIACRRMKEQLKEEAGYEKAVKELLAESELEVRNKIVVYIFEKNIDYEKLETVQKVARNEHNIFYLLEGSDNYTLITHDKYSQEIEKQFKLKIMRANKNVALINYKTPKDVEGTCGFVAYITSLFTEHGVNIIEILSCWTDNIFVIEAKDVPKVMGFLRF